MREVESDGFDRRTGEHVRVVQLMDVKVPRAARPHVYERYVLISHEGLRRMRDAKLTKTELAIWAQMHLHARMDDTFRVTPRMLQQHFGFTAPRVHTALNRLIEVGLIDRVALGNYAPNPEATWAGSGAGHRVAMTERHPESDEIAEPAAQEEEA